jgi:quinol monooxygenase YgiN
MIKIVAKNFIKEDKMDEFIALAKNLVEETNKNDEGCLKYELFQDMNNPNVYTIIEEWENGEFLQKHIASKHFKEIILQIDPCCEKPGEMNIYKKVE